MIIMKKTKIMVSAMLFGAFACVMSSCNKDDNDIDNEIPYVENVTITPELQQLIQKSCDESLCVSGHFSAEKQKELDKWAQSIYRSLFGQDAPSLSKNGKSVEMSFDEEKYEEVKRMYEGNAYEGKVDIINGNYKEDLGNWGPTKYNAYIAVFCRLHEDYTLDVTFIPVNGYFKTAGSVFMKLGSANNGHCFNNGIFVDYPQYATKVAVTLNINEFAKGNPDAKENSHYCDDAWKAHESIKELFPFDANGNGSINICPLILTDDDNQSRYYTHPIHIKTKDYYNTKIPYGSQSTSDDFGDVFGIQEGVRVVNNGPNNGNLCGTYQCVELTKKYMMLMYSFPWLGGSATEWFNKLCKREDIDAFIKTSEKVRVGDIVSLGTSVSYGHVGVVSYVDYSTNPETVYVSNQNSKGAKPMGATSWSLSKGNIAGWLRPKSSSSTYSSFEHKEISEVDPSDDIPGDNDEPVVSEKLAVTFSGNTEVDAEQPLYVTINTNKPCNIEIVDDFGDVIDSKNNVSSWRYMVDTKKCGYKELMVRTTDVNSGETKNATFEYYVDYITVPNVSSSKSDIKVETLKGQNMPMVLHPNRSIDDYIKASYRGDGYFRIERKSGYLTGDNRLVVMIVEGSSASDLKDISKSEYIAGSADNTNLTYTEIWCFDRKSFSTERSFYVLVVDTDLTLETDSGVAQGYYIGPITLSPVE